MSTADETTATGTGGKFRKRPFRRQQTTPYDRPPTAIRPINNNNNFNWLTRHVVDPASKLISYGANRFFDSILRRKRLTGPPPSIQHAPQEVNRDAGGGVQDVVSNELIVRGPSQPINSPDCNGISDLEQLLKGNTFTRSEIDRLTELLHSKAAEVSHVDEHEQKETQSGLDSHGKIAVGLTIENRNKGIQYHGTTSTSFFSPKVLEDDAGSPAEIAKAYMGSRSTAVSPSMLSMHSQGRREDAVLFGNTPFNSKSPIVPFGNKSSLRHGAVGNGFITPRSRGRAAIYSMARTPYSRGDATSIVKFQRDGKSDNDFGLSAASSSRSLSSHVEQLESKSTALKRGSSYLDDEIGTSVGPMRRIRQKHNLLAPRVSHKLNGSGNSSAKQKQPLISGANDRLKGVEDNGNGSVPSTSYASVPSKSSKVASRILQHLDELIPKERLSSNSPFELTPKEKLSSKSPFELTPGMLHGQALKSMENVGTSKFIFMQDLQDDHKMEDRSNVNFSDARESTYGKQKIVEEKGGEEYVAPLEPLNSTKKNESVVLLKDPGPSGAAFEPVVRNSPSQPPPQKKNAFRMSALEDSFDQDDDLHDNGMAPTLLPEKKTPTEAPLMESRLSTAEEPIPVKATIQPEEVKSTSSFVSRKTSDFGFPSSGNDGDSCGALISPTPEESIKVMQPAISVDKPNNPPPLFSFSSSVGNNFSSLPSESAGKTSEPKLEIPSSFITTPVPNGSPSKTPGTGNGNQNPPGTENGNLNPPGTENSNLNPPKPADTATAKWPFASNPSTFSLDTSSYGNPNPSKPADLIQTPDISTPALNEPVTSNPSTFLFNGSSSSDKNQIGTTVAISTVAAPLTSITSSTSSGIGTSTSLSFAGLYGSINPKEPILRFTAATYPSTSVSTASTTITSEATDSKTNTTPSFGVGSNPTFSPFSSASSGTSIFGSTSTPFHGIPVTQSSSAPLNTPSASFGANTSTPLGSSFSNSQPFNTNPTSPFGSSLASSAATNSNTPTSVSEPTVTNTIGSSSAAPSSPFVFGSSSSPTPFNTNGSSSAATLPFTFGSSFSSTSATTVGSSPAATLSPFAFGGNPSSTSTNTIGSSPAATLSPFSFGGNSFASSSAPMSTSSAPPNPFGSVFSSSSTPSSGFLFGATSSTPSAPTNTAPSIFTSSTNISSNPVFPFSAQSAPSLQTPSQPVFGSSTFGFGASPGTNNMNAEDSMAEDPVQSTSLFGQQAVSPPPAFAFGQPPPAQVNPFQFGGQQSQVNQVNPNPFQPSGSGEFNGTGSFSLGTAGGDKSGRRIVRPSKSRNRKK